MCYEVMMALKSSKPKEDNAVYEYMLQKEAEGKNKKLVKIAGLIKFLRIYHYLSLELYQDFNITSSYICKKDHFISSLSLPFNLSNSIIF